MAGRPAFLIQRWHYDHPEIPDAIAVIGVTDGQLSMHYFDYRGVYRVYAVSLEEDEWRFWRDAPGFSQRFTGILSDDGNTITGQGQLSRDGSAWEDDLAITYRRSPAGSGPLTGGHPDLNAMARRVIDASHYMTLGTTDPDGRPRLSPVYYTPARYSDFYWVSSPDAQHSRNLAERPGAEIVIFDSTAPAGEGEAVYITATARAIPDDELEAVCPEAFRTTAGARRFTPDDLRGGAAAAVRRARTIMRGPCRRASSRPRPRHRHPPAGRPHRLIGGAGETGIISNARPCWPYTPVTRSMW